MNRGRDFVFHPEKVTLPSGRAQVIFGKDRDEFICPIANEELQAALHEAMCHMQALAKDLRYALEYDDHNDRLVGTVEQILERIMKEDL